MVVSSNKHLWTLPILFFFLVIPTAQGSWVGVHPSGNFSVDFPFWEAVRIVQWKDESTLDRTNYQDLLVAAEFELQINRNLSGGKVNITYYTLEASRNNDATNFISKVCSDRYCNHTIFSGSSVSIGSNIFTFTLPIPELESDTVFNVFIEYRIPNFIEKKGIYYVAKFNAVCQTIDFCPPEHTMMRTFIIPYEDTIIEKLIPESIESATFHEKDEQYLTFSESYKEIWFSRISETNFWLPFLWQFLGAVLGAFLAILAAESWKFVRRRGSKIPQEKVARKSTDMRNPRVSRNDDKRFLIKVYQNNRDYHATMATQGLTILLTLATLIVAILTLINVAYSSVVSPWLSTWFPIMNLVIVAAIIITWIYVYKVRISPDKRSASNFHLQYKIFLSELYPRLFQLSENDNKRIYDRELRKKPNF
ncbi:MAG: hypothetical protein HY369_05320 [Candidatus Aenigmarchaeota archaeon]|nr:hypothetical protein [Candidatus Aenigmarchaeota archaeon]